MRRRIVGPLLSILALYGGLASQARHESPPTVGGSDCTMCRGLQGQPGPTAVQLPVHPDPRQVNQSAFEELYLPLKESLFDRHAGEWVAIVDGRLMPVDEKGNVMPTKSLETLLAVADEVGPEAAHRFIFRVGEEGEVRYRPTVNSHPEWIGRGFFPLFAGNLWTTPPGVYIAPRGASYDEGVKIGPGINEPDGPRAELRVSPMSGDGEVSLSFVVSTGFDGHAILGHGAAQALQLSRWEIPGELNMVGFDTPLRRARAHFRVEGSEVLDASAPVGIWPPK